MSVTYNVGRSDEDRYSGIFINNNTVLYSIFDGHGGKEVSTFLSHELPKLLKKKLHNVDFDNKNLVHDIINNIIMITDEYICMHFISGSTCTMLLINDKGNYKNVYTINIGDSKTILLSNDIFIETKDHVPNEEIERINKAGGFVANNRVNGVLATSRSFGDVELKKINNIPKQYGPVSSVPDMMYHKINIKCKAIMGSDGLFEKIETKNFIEQAKELNFNTKLIVNEARKRTNDDITCIIVDI